MTRITVALVALLVALGGSWVWGHHVGAAGVQARWDAAKTDQAQVVAHAETHNAAQSTAWINQFSAINAKYEADSHAQAPAIAETVAAGVAAGTLRLRDGTHVCPGAVSAATARSRAADAAATQALADRTQTAIAAVRAGDEADRRESRLDAQVMALQAVLRAERTPLTQTSGKPDSAKPSTSAH
jgi:hypothetical protein